MAFWLAHLVFIESSAAEKEEDQDYFDRLYSLLVQRAAHGLRPKEIADAHAFAMQAFHGDGD